MFYSNVIARSVNTFIPLGDEMINSSLVETGRSLIDPHPHPLLHFLVRMKPMTRNVFLQVAKNVKVTRGKIWPVRRMLKCLPAKCLKLIPHRIVNMRTGVIRQKDDSVQQHSRAFWVHGASQFLQRVCMALRIDCGSTPLYSSLPASISNAGRTHFTLCSPPEQERNNCVDLCVFTVHVSYPTGCSIDT